MKPPQPRPGGYHTASTPCHPLRHGAGGAGGMRREPRGGGGTRFAPTPPSEPKPLSSRAATTFPARLPAPGQRWPGGEQGTGAIAPQPPPAAPAPASAPWPPPAAMAGPGPGPGPGTTAWVPGLLAPPAGRGGDGEGEGEGDEGEAGRRLQVPASRAAATPLPLPCRPRGKRKRRCGGQRPQGGFWGQRGGAEPPGAMPSPPGWCRGPTGASPPGDAGTGALPGLGRGLGFKGGLENGNPRC